MRWWRQWRQKRRGEEITIAYADPLKAGRHPFQTYILSLCVLTGTPLIFGSVPPGTLEEHLSPALVAAWGVMLVGGAAIALFGSFWGNDKRYDTALTAERIGLAFVGIAAFVYGVAIIYELRWEGLIAGGIVMGFGLACVVRAADIGKIFMRALHPESKAPVEKEEGR